MSLVHVSYTKQTQGVNNEAFVLWALLNLLLKKYSMEGQPADEVERNISFEVKTKTNKILELGSIYSL